MNLPCPNPAPLDMDEADSNLIRHALFELEAVGYSLDGDPLDEAIYLHTIAIVRHFVQCGHSGASAAQHTAIITQLLQFKPLGSITDDPSEWVEVGEDGLGQPMFQNRRCSSCFSYDGGHTYHDLDTDRTGWRRKVFGKKKMMKTPLSTRGSSGVAE